jgi:hypothetical protein
MNNEFMETTKRKCYKYNELYLAALNVLNVCLEDAENDLQALKLKKRRQRRMNILSGRKLMLDLRFSQRWF